MPFRKDPQSDPGKPLQLALLNPLRCNFGDTKIVPLAQIS